MTKEELDLILEQVAASNHTTVEHIRKEIQVTLDIAMNNPSPAIQAKWAAIPRKGDKPTIEEFIEYVAALTKYLQSLS